jgi:hypothetical protein
MREHPLVAVKPDDVRPPGDIASQHALDVPSHTFLVTQDKQRHADQSVADWPVGRIRRFRRIGAKSFGHRQRPPIAATRKAVDVQAPQRSQAVISAISKALVQAADISGHVPFVRKSAAPSAAYNCILRRASRLSAGPESACSTHSLRAYFVCIASLIGIP